MKTRFGAMTLLRCARKATGSVVICRSSPKIACALKTGLDHDDFESHYHFRSMILCLCRGVSDRTVRLTVANGATSVDAVAARCGAGTDCGSCRHAIQDLVDDEAAAPIPIARCDSASSSAA